MPTWDQTADMEEGTLADFNVTVGAVAATTGSKKNGSYGMDATLSVAVAYGELTGPTAEVRMTGEAWFDPNGFSGNTNDAFVVALFFTGVAINVALVQCRKDASGYSLRCIGQQDSGVGVNGTYSAITDDWHLLRWVWRASTGAGANNGTVVLYVDNVRFDSVTGLDSDTLVCESAKFGNMSVVATISGNVYFDDCRIANESEFLQSGLAGTLTSTGTIVKKAKKALAGTLTSSGIVSSVLHLAFHLAASIIASIAPAIGIHIKTTPATDTEAKIAPTAAIEEKR